MTTNKFGEVMPETEEEYIERLMSLKHQYFVLVQNGAPIHETEVLRDEAARLQSYWDSQKQKNQN